MKRNLIQYLRDYGEKSFRELPFSEVDALVFAQFAYLKMTGIVPGFNKGPGVSWKDMAEHPQAEQMFLDPVFGKGYRRMFQLVLKSRRYRNIRVNYFVEWFDEEEQVQFSAVTFLLGKTSAYVAYRGTDESLIGWKEDFNMSYMKSIPAQRRALAYLKGAARYTEGRIILGGHSKGGNLAIYAGTNSAQEIQRRIRRIYSFDGPGFHKSFYEKPGFVQVQDRYCKIVPEESLVGMLFANYQHYRIVESYHSGIIQHNPMQWKIRKGRFVYRRDLDWSSKRKSAILNAWFSSLTKEQTTVFVETVYDLFLAANVESVYQLLKEPFGILRRMLTGFRKLDKAKRGTIWGIIGALFLTIRGFLKPGRMKG